MLLKREIYRIITKWRAVRCTSNKKGTSQSEKDKRVTVVVMFVGLCELAL